VKVARGSAYPLDYPETGVAETLGAVESFRGSALGLRLVHDGADCVERGGSCLLDPINAAQARGYRVNPAFPSAARGFRLAREET